MIDLEQLADIHDIPYWGSLEFSPDGRQLTWIMDRGDHYQVYRSALGAGEPEPLTDWSSETPRELRWAPDGRRLAISADRDGNEFNQLRTLNLDDGSVTRLTDDHEVQYWLGRFSPDGAWLTYAGNDRDRSQQDLIVRRLDDNHILRARPREGVNGQLFAGRWAPQSDRLTLTEFVHPQWSDIRLLSVPSGGDEPVLESRGLGAHLPGPWLPDGSGFYVLSDVEREQVGLFRFDLSKQSLEPVVTPEWDVEHFDPSRDGRVLAWSVNEDGISRAHVRREGVPDTRLGLPPGSISHLSLAPDGQHLAVALTSATSSADIYLARIEDGSIQRLTQTMRGVDPARLTPPDLVRIPRGDGTSVPAWLYKPAEADRRRPVPVVVSVHGGPMSQERLEYRYLGMYHFLMARGIAVLAPNMTGSTGYGRSYTARLNRDWGGIDLEDLDAVVGWLRAQDWVNARRIGIFGGSYGGYVVLAALAMRPGLFATGVDIFGPSNLVTLIQSGPPTWKSFEHAALGHPERDRELLLERSPLTHVDRIDVPLLVVQGANDPRVPKPESDQIVEALRQRGVKVRYDVYEDEGHGFVRHANRLRVTKDAAQWLVEHLG